MLNYYKLTCEPEILLPYSYWGFIVREYYLLVYLNALWTVDLTETGHLR